jgi:hypothetical protein
MSAAGAKAALQGYRLQALYTLATVLRPDAADLVFHPEGKEDLDVYAGEELRRVIQVKGHAAPLSLSALGLGQEDSFLSRAADLVPRQGLEIVVATFGPVGPELEGAWAGEPNHRASVIVKLRQQGFTDEKIANLFGSVRFEPVDEGALRREVFEFLSDSLLGGDPESAFDLLVAWLYRAAEERRRLRTADVRERISSVGRYLAERAAHHQEWFTSILPLQDVQLSEERRVELAGEYYRGVSARYDHILAELDVVREFKLRQIEDAFADSRVVIVHGASGQGKSTIGLRYFHDFVPAAWRFAVRLVADRAHAVRVAAALAGHLRAIAAPMYVYLDVSPRDADWPELVRSLVELPEVRVLVTIREEDLARVDVSETELGFPNSVELQFDKMEAEEIYGRLVARRPAEAFLSFAEAWTRFGGDGPLLEFTYLVTQNESLEATIRAQIRRLRDEVQQGRMAAHDLAFLRLASLAAAYEARVDLVGLAAEVALVDPIRTLELLEREYLVRRSGDGRYVEGLHPIRSTILSAELVDPVFTPWAASAAVCIMYIPEMDLETFLFHAFLDHPEDAAILLNALAGRQLQTWGGLAGIGRSLIWLGLRGYVEENRGIIEEGRERLSDAWSLLLDFDIADVMPGEEPFIEQMPGAHPDVLELGRELRARQSDKRAVFGPFEEWLSGVAHAPAAPSSTLDWTGFAELCFWALRLGMDAPLVDAAWAVDLGTAVEDTPLPVVGRVVLAWSYGPADRFEARVLPHTPRLVSRYRDTMGVVSLEESEDRLFAHFIVPLDALSDADQNTTAEDQGNAKRGLHELTLERIDVLRQILPGRQQYGTKGYGHQNPLAPWPYDPTEKGGVLARYLHPEWGPRLNGTFANLANLPARPETWAEYADIIMATRQAVLISLSQLRKGVIAHFRSDKPVRILGKYLDPRAWDQATRRLDRLPKLPKTAVDYWGFSSEGQDRTGETALVADAGGAGTYRARANFILDQHRPLLEATRECLSPLENFFRQANGPLTLNSFLGRADSDEQRQRYLEVAVAQGIPTEKSFLSTYNFAEALRHLPVFQKEFRARFSRLIPQARLDRLERDESEVMNAAWALWYSFVEQPERQWRAPEMRACQVFSDILERIRDGIRTGFGALPAHEIRARIQSEALEWEGLPALWLVVEVANPLQTHEAIRAVADVLQSALGEIVIQSAEQFAVETNWPNILIVPTFKGMNPAAALWRFRPFSFYSDKNIHENPATWFPLPMPSDVARAVGVELRDEGVEAPLKRLQFGIAELWNLLAHLSDFLRIPDPVDDEGGAVLQNYMGGVADRISTAFTRVADLWVDALEDVSSIDGWIDRPLLAEIHNGLLALKDGLMPSEDYNPGDVIELQQLAAWADRLQPLLTLPEAMRLARIADAHGIDAV